MQVKQKVTLYMSPELHRRLKIKAAIDSEPMSELAERALIFYLTHSDVVDEVEGAYGRTHQVYACPECETSLVVREEELVAISDSPGVIAESKIPVNKVSQVGTSKEGEEQLVPC